MSEIVEHLIWKLIERPSVHKIHNWKDEEINQIKDTLKPEFKFINFDKNMLPLIFFEVKNWGYENFKEHLESLICEEGKEIDKKLILKPEKIRVIKIKEDKIFSNFKNINMFVEFIDDIERMSFDEIKIEILKENNKIIENFRIVAPDWHNVLMAKQRFLLSKINPKLYLSCKKEIDSFNDAFQTIMTPTKKWLKSFFTGYPDFSLKELNSIIPDKTRIYSN